MAEWADRIITSISELCTSFVLRNHFPWGIEGLDWSWVLTVRVDRASRPKQFNTSESVSAFRHWLCGGAWWRRDTSAGAREEAPWFSFSDQKKSARVPHPQRPRHRKRPRHAAIPRSSPLSLPSSSWVIPTRTRRTPPSSLPQPLSVFTPKT